jgi:lipopolysaccharide biosynthesis glycosyltransferase
VDWAEQGWLNIVFKDSFYELHYIYNGNLVSKLQDTYLWSQFSSAITIVHYTVAKGWMSFRHLSIVHYTVAKGWMSFRHLDPENPFMLMQVAEVSCKICDVNVGIAQIEFEVAKEVARKKRNKEGMQNMMEYKEWLKDCKTLLARTEAKHATCRAKFLMNE